MKTLFLLFALLCCEHCFAGTTLTEFPETPGAGWKVQGNVTSVYDGDTVTADLLMPLDVTLRGQKLRLWGIDTPELRGGTAATKAKGRAARDWLREQIEGADAVLIEIYQRTNGEMLRGKYGRIIVTIYARQDGEWRNLNREIVEAGFGRFVSY